MGPKPKDARSKLECKGGKSKTKASHSGGKRKQIEDFTHDVNPKRIRVSRKNAWQHLGAQKNEGQKGLSTSQVVGRSSVKQGTQSIWRKPPGTFKNLSHEKAYINLGNTEIILTKGVNWKVFNSNDRVMDRVRRTFSRMEWLKLSELDLSHVSRACLVEFYQNIYTDKEQMEDKSVWDSNGLCVRMNGQDMCITPKDWGECFGLNFQSELKGEPEKYSCDEYWMELIGEEYKSCFRSKYASNLNDLHDRICALFIARSIVCRSQPISSVMPSDIWILEQMKKGNTINTERGYLWMINLISSLRPNQSSMIVWGRLKSMSLTTISGSQSYLRP